MGQKGGRKNKGNNRGKYYKQVFQKKVRGPDKRRKRPCIFYIFFVLFLEFSTDKGSFVDTE